MNALDRARADLATGQPWMARDRLAGRLCNVYDTETVTLLAEVHLGMTNLPDAGALLFTLGRSDPTAVEAIAAWETKYPGVAERWGSLPRMIRVEDNESVRALRESAGCERPVARTPQNHWTPNAWEDRLLALGCGLVILIFVAVVVTGWIGLVLWIRN